MKTAIIFAYHNVGVRCLKTLIAQKIKIELIITHEDTPNENIWFDSVKQVAQDYDLPYITPDNPNTEETIEKIRELAPNFIFSFYYRHMLCEQILQIPNCGAFNMHGSLLPKYRGRVPINWAIINDEKETGVTLHVMETKPDYGAIVEQFPIPILPDDTAKEVFDKATLAAEICLLRALPKLVAGEVILTPQNITAGSYFSGRKAEDGRIDWQKSARAIHNLVRAVTKPYPSAFTDLPAGRLVIWRTRCIDSDENAPIQQQATKPAIFIDTDMNKIIIRCADGGRLIVLDAQIDDHQLTTSNFTGFFGQITYLETPRHIKT